MPPKPQAKNEDEDLSAIQWFAINCILKFEGKKSRGQQILQAFQQKPKAFQKNITRDEIINFAKDSGLYVDPNTLNEKQKKDSKFLEGKNLELTPAVLAEAFKKKILEMEKQGKKAKKDLMEVKDEPQDDKKATQAKDQKKKDDKKDNKKQGKQPEQPPPEEVKKEEPLVPEKEYKKANDQFYLLFDYPKQKEEFLELSKQQCNIDLIINIKQKVSWSQNEHDLSLLQHKENFEDDLKQRMEDFIEANPEGEDGEQQQEDEGVNELKELRKKKEQEKLTEEDLSYVKECQDFITMFKKLRKSADPQQTIRKIVVKEIVYEVDPQSEEESQKNLIDMLLEEICAFSFDVLSFQEWVKTKKTVPLLPQDKSQQDQKKKEEIPVPVVEEVKDDKKDSKKPGKAEPPKKDEKKDDKKGGKKDAKEEEKKEEKPPEEKPVVKEEPEQKKPIVEPFFHYYKQINDVKLEQTGVGLMLEVMLDELEGEKHQQGMTVNQKDQEEANKVDSILAELDGFVKFRTLNTLKTFKEEEEVNNENKSTPFKVIIDESDDIEQRAYSQKLFNLDQVSSRERKLFQNLLFPGIDRHMMPEIPEKSEALRKAEKSQLYPFISCSVQEFERRLVINKFEDIMKDAEPEREWNFGNRVFLERHNKNTLTQSFYRALLQDPTLLLKYNEKDDNLFVLLYFKNPPGRIFRKKWSAEWRVLPNLENWINYFKNNDQNMKNEFYYNIDYENIGNLHERIKYMFPTDNSVMIGQKLLVGDKFQFRYRVVKEGVVFGIREANGFPSFWAIFDNNTQLLVELEKQKKPAKIEQQQLPTEEAQLSQSQLQQSQVSVNAQLQQSNVGNQEQSILDPEYDIPKASFTITLPNGHIVKFLHNGDVLQLRQNPHKKMMLREFEDIINPYEEAKPNSEIELKRIITGKGSVIKYMKDGSLIILYANGNISYSQQRNGIWITINNKGLRKCRNSREGSESELDAIPCARRTDPEQGSKIIIRSDQTLIIQYKDNSTYVKFKDGTQMYTSPKKDYIIVEHQDFATVKVIFDEVKMRTDTIIGMGSTYANVGFENIFERSNNGRVVETYLPDKTKVIGYREKKELPGYNQFSTNNIHLIYMEDGSITKVMDNGEIVFISAVDRVALNEKGENRGTNDIDYWLQLFCVPEERKAGVYSIELLQQQLWTRDQEGNYFCLKSNGEINTKIAVSLNIQQSQQQQQQDDQDRPGTPEIPDGDFIEEENKFLPQPERWVPPRLFVVNNNNTGYELLSEEQMKNYLRLKQNDKNCIQLFDENVPNYEKCSSLSFISQLLSFEQKKIFQIQPDIPRTLDIVPHSAKKLTEPEKKIYLFRNTLKFQNFDGDVREQHKKDLEKYDLWKKDNQKQQNEFGIQQKSEEDKDKEFNIQLKILESRKSNFSEKTYDQVKDDVCRVFLEKSEFIKGSRYLSANDLSNIDKQKELENVNMDVSIEEDKDQKPKEVKFQKNLKDDKFLESSMKNQKRKDYFVTNYFETIEGTNAFNELIKDNRVLNLVISPKVKRLTAEAIHKQTSPEKAEAGMQQAGQTMQSDRPIMNVEPEKGEKNIQQKTIIIKPSVFTVQEIEDQRRLQQEEQEAQRIRQVRTKEFNVYGQERKSSQTKKVPCLLRTSPKSELNQKYILTESLTDNKVKISSMHNRLYLKAPTIAEMRNTGSHNALAKTIDKKNSVDEIENKKNTMITADLNDQLRRDILIIPVCARFGLLKIGSIYETTIIVKNEDILAQRIVIKQPATKFAKVFMKQMGPIALGLQREIIVRFDASPEVIGTFQDEFQIISKHEIYKIPIHASIMKQEEYDKLDQESKELNKKPILKAHVRELKIGSQKEQDSKMQDLMDSANSDLLPKLQNFDKSYKIDPYANNAKKKEEDVEDYDQQFNE